MKRLFLIFSVFVLFQCANSKTPYSPYEKDGFFKHQLLPYFGKKDSSVLFMVYMNAANNLESYGVYDFYDEIAQSKLLSPNKDITVIVLMDRISGYSTSYGNWTGTRIYRITKDKVERIGGMSINGTVMHTTGDSDELNMGDGNTLKDFVAYCFNNYEADYYVLDIWNHGDGWKGGQLNVPQIAKGISIDDESGSDYLTMSEVSTALENAIGLIGRKIDILYFDACLMQMVEVAYELKDSVKYVVASEDLVPGTGLNYKDSLDRISYLDIPSSFNIANELFKAYKNQYYYQYETTLSIIDTSGMNTLRNAIDTFAVNLTNEAISTITNARDSIRSFFNSITNTEYMYADLYAFASKMSGVTGAVDVMNAIANVVKANYYNTAPTAYGISIYMPTPRTLVENAYISNITGIKFLNDSKWKDFIVWYKNQ